MCVCVIMLIIWWNQKQPAQFWRGWALWRLQVPSSWVDLIHSNKSALWTNVALLSWQFRVLGLSDAPAWVCVGPAHGRDRVLFYLDTEVVWTRLNNPSGLENWTLPQPGVENWSADSWKILVVDTFSRCREKVRIGSSSVGVKDRVFTLYKNGSCEITQWLFETFGRERGCVIEQEPFL